MTDHAETDEMGRMGVAHVYGDHIDTDVIIPARHCTTTDESELAPHCLEDLDPNFVDESAPGDFLVAGSNFGCGSSREQAPLAIKGAGVAGVIAASFARIFFRNAINVGLPVFESERAAEAIEEGDRIEVAPGAGCIVNHTADETYEVSTHPAAVSDIIEAGGMVEYVRRQLGRPVRREELVYDWNTEESDPRRSAVEFDDETLRDGLQSASARDPGIGDKLRLLHLMDDLGIDAADLGLAGASDRQFDHVRRLASEIEECDMGISPGSACRTLKADIEPIARIAHEVGLPIEVQCFIGSSPIRQYVEDWSVDQLVSRTEEAVTFAVEQGLPVMYVTEDTTRARPETLERLYSSAIECGARRICAADTVGHCTPAGTRSMIEFMREIADRADDEVAVDWHGHRDRGLGLANAWVAARAGADRIHGTGLGIGERSGNTPMDLLLVNCQLEGWIDHNLAELCEYCELVSEMADIPIPENYPVIGPDAFRTATGVHASAIAKARDKGDRWLADHVYSAVPAEMVGRRQIVEVGPMSGRANVAQWMKRHGRDPSDRQLEAVLEAAKTSDRVLTDRQIEEVLESDG